MDRARTKSPSPISFPEFGSVLVVDDSVVGAANVDVLGTDGADVVVSMLKFLHGRT